MSGRKRRSKGAWWGLNQERGVRLINIARHVQKVPKVVMMNVIWIQYLKPSTATSPFLADMDVSWDMPPRTPSLKPENA